MQMDKEQEKKLHDAMIALFLLMLKYSNKINPLLGLFKSNRDTVKAAINKIYATYTKDNQLIMSSKQINAEIKKLEPMLKKIGNDLMVKEKDLLSSLLPMIYGETYYRTYYELSKGMSLDVKKLIDSIIGKSINQKIEGKTAFDRNKDNKIKFISKANRDMKDQLKKGVSIEKINKTIDKNFNTGVSFSHRLIGNEIIRNFGNAQREVFNTAIILTVLFSAVLDERTTPLCESLDGNVYPLGEAPEPPLHIWCRSMLLPIITNWNDKQNNESWDTFKERNDI